MGCRLFISCEFSHGIELSSTYLPSWEQDLHCGDGSSWIIRPPREKTLRSTKPPPGEDSSMEFKSSLSCDLGKNPFLLPLSCG